MRILVAGDFCPRDRVAALFDNGGFDLVLGNVRDIVSSFDYSIVNFECPVTSGSVSPIAKCGPNLQCSQKGLEAVKWAGFKCITLANNHFRDFGDAGVKNTIEIADSLGLDHVGGGINISDSSRTLFKTIGSKTIAIINCCEHEFSIATDHTGGSNPLNPVKQYYAIKEAKTIADYVLVIVHGGHEHFQLPSVRMVETYRFFIDAGADVVVNHHQHCYSGYEKYNGKPIFYGLGNFCFDNPSYRDSSWNAGILVMLSFSETICFDIIPYLQCNEKADIKPLPSNAFNQKLEELNSTIAAPQNLEHSDNEYYNSKTRHYSDIFEPIDNKLYSTLKNRGWLPSLISKRRRLRAENYICCESHYDILSHWFKKI